jgi:hypothetical protein
MRRAESASQESDVSAKADPGGTAGDLSVANR